MPEAALQARFRENLARLGLADAPDGWVVAVSGGCDSVALLYLLRFCLPERPFGLVVAHLDHAMRPDSAADAHWLAGVCRAWGVPLVRERLAEAPAGEDAARRARYAFLRATAERVGARWIATAHHADDQAETVLFRALRGTGLDGLGGMRPVSAAGLVRPLLPFWRSEVESFARERGLRWRTDASNLSRDPARNLIRLEMLPLAERSFAPGARRSLVSLAQLAREAEEALDAVVERLEREVVTREAGALLLARSRLLDYDWAIGSRLFRKLLRQFGVVLGGTGTRTALQFITHARSGRELHLPGGVRVRLEFDVARLERHATVPADEPLTLERPDQPGAGTARIGGRTVRVEWRLSRGEDGSEIGGSRAVLPLHALRPPLVLRGWRPGDRMRTSGGTKTLKKLFAEHRLPRSARSRLPVLVDATGAVLWVAELPRSPLCTPRPGETAFILTALHD